MIELDVNDRQYYRPVRFGEGSLVVDRKQFKTVPKVPVQMWGQNWVIQPTFFAGKHFLRYNDESTVWEVNPSKAWSLGLFSPKWEVKFRRRA